MKDMLKKIEQEIQECEERLEWLYDNYSGCDWCCGGGDEEVEELNQEIEGLQFQRKVLRLRVLRD